MVWVYLINYKYLCLFMFINHLGACIRPPFPLFSFATKPASVSNLRKAKEKELHSGRGANQRPNQNHLNRQNPNQVSLLFKKDNFSSI